ncbi:MAG TPA: GNAT family N-acetyltransferase [Hyphomicrobiales bacterium]|nr:GNAT family N-acetyltransferase [Rhodobiaceae bacterium]HXK54525.1 GNAT family N-acetyltransferase [Hyphomicrobiales bacterium]
MASSNTATSKGKRTSNLVLRPLQAGDLDAAIAIDAAVGGRVRRGFFERRLTAATKDPKGFIYVGAEEDGQLKGFAMVHVLAGEFGAPGEIAVLDAVGVDPAAQGRGIGRALMARVDEVMRDKKISEMHTQADWTDLSLLGFLDAAGFELAPRTILARDIGNPNSW